MTRALRAATLVFGLLAAPLAATGRTPRGVRPTSPYCETSTPDPTRVA